MPCTTLESLLHSNFTSQVNNGYNGKFIAFLDQQARLKRMVAKSVTYPFLIYIKEKGNRSSKRKSITKYRRLQIGA